MCKNAIKRWEFIELPIPAGSTATKFVFGDQPQLRDDTTQDIIVQGLETFSIEAMPLTPLGNPVASTAQLQNSFLVLYLNTPDSSDEAVHWLPMIKLNAMFQSLATGTMQQQFMPIEFSNVKIDWNKSYIWTPVSYASETTFSLVLGVTYKRLPPGEWAKLTRNQTPGM